MSGTMGDCFVSIRENCQGPMVPYHPDHQRFCCRACSDQWFQAERREALEWYRACGMKPAPRDQQQQEAMSGE
jgi:hypothetical protein